MNGLELLIDKLSIPGFIASVAILLFLILQLTGEICEMCGKVVPVFLKIRKLFHRRKEKKLEKERQEAETLETLAQVKELLSSVDSHYSADNIAQRNEWMNWVNNRAVTYDAAIEELMSVKDRLRENNEMTLELYINVNRNRILDFASKVANDSVLASREEFNRIYKVNRDYHEILAKYGKENGEVDTAMRIIDEAYEYRMRHHCFIEDLRGYDN